MLKNNNYGGWNRAYRETGRPPIFGKELNSTALWHCCAFSPVAYQSLQVFFFPALFIVGVMSFC
jgi:hypothetical protein